MNMANSTNSWQMFISLTTLLLLLINISFYVMSINKNTVLLKQRDLPYLSSMKLSVPNDKRNLLTLFTTYEGHDGDLPPSKLIYNWGSLVPWVRPVLFVSKNANHDFVTRAQGFGWEVCIIPVTNRYGMPVLSGMFQKVIADYNSAFYGYAKPGMFFTETLVDAVKLVLCQQKLLNHTLLAGRSNNHDTVENPNTPNLEKVVSKYSRAIYRNRARTRTLPKFREEPVDYFITTSEAIEWSKLVPIVVGRTGWENYILAETLSMVNVVDLTSMVQCYQQDTNMKQPKSNSDLYYNRRLLGRYYPLQNGTLNRAQFEIEEDIKGYFYIKKKPEYESMLSSSWRPVSVSSSVKRSQNASATRSVYRIRSYVRESKFPRKLGSTSEIANSVPRGHILPHKRQLSARNNLFSHTH